MFSNIEKQIFEKHQLVAGIDEAGRGCLAGPVASAIVAISRKDFESGCFNDFCKEAGLSKIKDSKQLSPRQREEIFQLIKNKPFIQWRVSFVGPSVIDRINIWQATLLSWRRCIAKLDKQPSYVFIDGKMNMPHLKIEQQPVIKGDQNIFILSLASIMAKVSRDKLMERFDRKYPEYELAQHKGYGTERHMEQLKIFGSSPIHRKSFEPVFVNLSLEEKIYHIVSQIPRGRTMTYKEVAQKIGRPKAYRVVGNILHKNTDPRVHCHRVIRSDGRFGGYNRGSWIKKELLEKEGIR